ncbi:MAG TPA: type II CAAX endopeptidase family protein [Tepidiformaceae bacterium]|nr:type II CAAX endopeptidase family protein [Tepidiformaceae bacterium]
MIGQRRFAMAPWGELSVLAGLWLAILAYVVPRLLISPVSKLLGGGPEYADIGTAFAKAAAVAEYADLRLAQAIPGAPFSDPPEMLGSVVAARVAWVLAIVSAGLFITAALVASRQRVGAFARFTGLNQFDIDRLWVPGLAVAVVYLLIGAYLRLIDASGIDALKGEPLVVTATSRDGVALALYGVTTVLAAPFGEEVFYRGFVFGGFANWGFWPAAATSSAIFALSHLDASTLVPFTLVGITLCWLYWRSGSLWDAIAFHSMFNLLSFILLLARN